jgi:uncharacterized protein (TIGR03083 family)
MMNARTDTMTTPRHAADVTTAEIDALLDLLVDLRPSEWSLPTPCTGWSVRDVAAHVAGALEDAARVRVMLRHHVRAKRFPDRAYIDALSAQHVEERGDRTPEQLVTEIRTLGAKAVRAGLRAPAPLRRIRLPETGALPPGSTLGYVSSVIRPRDVWMHRLDICTATGRMPAATGSEAEVVNQVVLDLATTWHGPPTALTLTGHGAGQWRLGDETATDALVADATDVLVMLSGRGSDPTLSGSPVAAEHLRASRVLF